VTVRVLNRFGFDSQTLLASAWVPKFELPTVQFLLLHTARAAGHILACSVMGQSNGKAGMQALACAINKQDEEWNSETNSGNNG
jgi:hypothetical protein